MLPSRQTARGAAARSASLEYRQEIIRKTAEFFFDVFGLPKTLTEVGIGPEKLELMAQNCAPKVANAFVPLTKEDVLAIFMDWL